jgi:hypothetical protein
MQPGARVEPEFVSAGEGQAAAEDAFGIIERYGISHVTDEQRTFMAGQMKHLPLPKDEVGVVENVDEHCAFAFWSRSTPSCAVTNPPTRPHPRNS